MSTLTLRAGLGRALTHLEMDNNWTNLNNDKYELNSTVQFTQVGIGVAPTISLDIAGTDAIRVPVGTDAQRPTGATGQIRFNTTSTSFEGYTGTTWSSLGGVKDVDGDTTILAESAPGANENQLTFIIANANAAILDANTFTFNVDVSTTGTYTGNGSGLTNIPNGALNNSSITINGVSTSLGGTRTLVTDDIAEDGAPINLWYTTARANTDIDARVTKAFVDALNVDADTLDSLDSTQFLRSDVDDTFGGNLIITGNLTVNGTTSTINTEEINLADNIININSNHTGAPTQDGGISINRGTSANTSLLWNETTDRWTFTNDGTVFYNIPISTEYNAYVHPSYTTRNITTTGVDVLSTFTSDAIGSVTAITTRTLPDATTSTAGVMSATDKTKLDGIESGAQVNVATNLSTTADTTTRTVLSSTGTNATLPTANTTEAGMMSSADRTKLDGIESGAQVNVATNLGTTADTTTRTITSSTGTSTVLPTANTTQAGVMSSDDRTKLDGIAAGAQVNVATNLGTTADTTTRTITSSTGTSTVLPTANTTQAGVMSSADRTKLDGIESGAQVNVATNLSTTANTTFRTILSSTGTNVDLPTANTTQAGVMSSADRTKLDGIATGAQTGTVTSVAAGNGLDFTSITTTGSVTLGTPGTITSATTNSVTATSHTHALTVTKTDVGLSNVENTALSTWPGTTNITTLGTITSGTWNAGVISSTYLDADTAHLSGAQTFSGAKTFSAATTINNTLTTTGLISGPAFQETVSTTTGGTYAVDCNVGVHYRTLNAATTISFTNTPGTNAARSITLAIRQDATGGRVITWPTVNWFWAENIEPPATTAANALDVYTVQIINTAGTIYYFASLSVKNAS